MRDDVADEVKALDQAARGTLRPYGVRFGAYHVFMPMLAETGSGRVEASIVGVVANGPA